MPGRTKLPLLGHMFVDLPDVRFTRYMHTAERLNAAFTASHEQVLIKARPDCSDMPSMWLQCLPAKRDLRCNVVPCNSECGCST